DFSPDSRRLVSAQEDGLLNFYDLPEPSEPKTVKMGFARPWVRFSPNGEELGVFSPRTNDVFILNAKSGKVVNRLVHPDVVRGLGWHPEGQMVATGCADCNGYIWKLSEPQQPLRVLTGHQSSLLEVVFHSSGEWLVSNSWDGAVRLWETATGQEI